MVTRTGIGADPGNDTYALAVIYAACSIRTIPETWSRLKYFAPIEEVLAKTELMSSRALDIYCEKGGDIIEALAGTCECSSPETRHFLEYHNVAKDLAKEFLAFLSIFVQKIAFILSSVANASFTHRLQFLREDIPNDLFEVR